VLVVLELGGPKSIGDLADSLGADPTTLTRNLALLENRALVKIRQGDDARSRVAAITLKGKNTLVRALPAWREAQAALAASVGSQVADNLRRLANSPQI
jgi:DNA-binding MarR family transcriptional regulator